MFLLSAYIVHAICLQRASAKGVSNPVPTKSVSRCMIHLSVNTPPRTASHTPAVTTRKVGQQLLFRTREYYEKNMLVNTKCWSVVKTHIILSCESGKGEAGLFWGIALAITKFIFVLQKDKNHLYFRSSQFYFIHTIRFGRIHVDPFQDCNPDSTLKKRSKGGHPLVLTFIDGWQILHVLNGDFENMFWYT